MAGVNRRLGQTANGSHQCLPAQLTGFCNRLSLYQLGQQRGTGHGGNTSLREKPNFIDASADDLQSEFQNVAARRIFDLARCIGIGHFAGIAWMLEVVENLGRVHRQELYRDSVVWPRATSPAASESLPRARGLAMPVGKPVSVHKARSG